jgi:hypothetical protein
MSGLLLLDARAAARLEPRKRYRYIPGTALLSLNNRYPRMIR